MDNRRLSRGKRMQDSNWVCGCHTIGGDGATLIDEINNLGLFEESHEVDPDTVGQCTGLTAAKSYRGTEPEDLLIFEGDIIKTKEYGKDIPDKHVNVADYDVFTVGWHEGGFCIESKTRRFRFTERAEIYEILGNVWDNPELLEVDGE